MMPTNSHAPAPRALSYRWIVLCIALAAQVTASLLNQGAYVLVPFWQSAYELSQAAAALPVAIMSAGQILFMVPLGLAMDRYGERRVVPLAMFGMGLAAFGALLFASSSYLTLLLFLAVVGAFSGAVQPGGTRAIMRWFPPELRGMAIGVRQAGLPLGTALAAVSLPAVAVTYGWTVAVSIAAMIVTAGGAVFLKFYHEGFAVSAIGTSSKPPSLRKLMITLARQSTLRRVLIAGITMASFQYALFTYVLIFLTSLGIPVITAGFLFALAQGIGMAGRVILPLASDHFCPGKRIRSLQWTMYACGLAVVALMLLPAQSPSWLLILVFAVLGLFGIGWYSLWLVEVSEMAPRTAATSTISFAMTVNLVDMTCFVPVGDGEFLAVKAAR